MDGEGLSGLEGDGFREGLWAVREDVLEGFVMPLAWAMVILLVLEGEWTPFELDWCSRGLLLPAGKLSTCLKRSR